MSEVEDSEKDLEKFAEINDLDNKSFNTLNKHSKQSRGSEDMEVNGPEHSFMCGVVEGFYGRPWTADQRKELFRRYCRLP